MKLPRLFYFPFLSLAAFVLAAMPASAVDFGQSFRDTASLHFFQPLARTQVEAVVMRRDGVVPVQAQRPMHAANLLTATECAMTRSASTMLQGEHRAGRAAFGSVCIIS